MHVKQEGGTYNIDLHNDIRDLSFINVFCNLFYVHDDIQYIYTFEIYERVEIHYAIAYVNRNAHVRMMKCQQHAIYEHFSAFSILPMIMICHSSRHIQYSHLIPSYLICINTRFLMMRHKKFARTLSLTLTRSSYSNLQHLSTLLK